MLRKHTSGREVQIYSREGVRLYVSPSERERFVRAAMNGPPLARIYCLTLTFTGCRMSEARYLRRRDVQIPEKLFSIPTLKRRFGRPVREVPIPDALISAIEKVHFMDMRRNPDAWLFSDDDRPPPRVCCYRWIKSTMDAAGIGGIHACPKGLRHGYGVQGAVSGIQPPTLQKWMGHASVETTMGYMKAAGAEELKIFSRMW